MDMNPRRLYSFIAGMVLAIFLCGSALATSGNERVARKQVEMSMLVAGSIVLNADGRVAEYRLDKADRLPQGVVQLIARYVPQWTFEPRMIDGKPAQVRTRMGLNLVARQTGATSYEIRIDGISFNDEEVPGESVTGKDMAPPTFPFTVLAKGMTGIVYVALKVDRAGQVDQVHVEQVNLTMLADTHTMELARRTLARSAATAAKAWTFNVPDKGPQANAPYWLVRVPVEFKLRDMNEHNASDDDSAWHAYVPGPRIPLPWKQAADESPAFKPDAMLGGMAYVSGHGPRLLTALEKD